MQSLHPHLYRPEAAATLVRIVLGQSDKHYPLLTPCMALYPDGASMSSSAVQKIQGRTSITTACQGTKGYIPRGLSTTERFSCLDRECHAWLRSGRTVSTPLPKNGLGRQMFCGGGLTVIVTYTMTDGGSRQSATSAGAAMQAMVYSGMNGIGLALVVPCVQSLIADYTLAERRGAAFGVLYFTGAIGEAYFLCLLASDAQS